MLSRVFFKDFLPTLIKEATFGVSLSIELLQFSGGLSVYARLNSQLCTVVVLR